MKKNPYGIQRLLKAFFDKIQQICQFLKFSIDRKKSMSMLNCDYCWFGED